MKPILLRLFALFILGGLTARPAAQPASSPPGPAGPHPPTAADSPRFADLDQASPAVRDAVRQAQQAAASARTVIGPATTSGEAGVARAVAQASAAIVQESRIARTDLLAERQAALVRLRLAQSASERARLVTELRTRTGQRLEEQRETARLVRDRLRELRDTTALTPKPGGG